MSTLPKKGFLTIGISTEIAWPGTEQTVLYRGHTFRLFPLTDNHSRMIRVETSEQFPQIEAEKIALELLSALGWAEQGGISTTLQIWATCPINIGIGPTGVIGDCHLKTLLNPAEPKAKLALALYREGWSVNLEPYKLLGFYKVINILFHYGRDQEKWINDHLRYVKGRRALERIDHIKSENGDVGHYLYASGRCAVAHAFGDPVVNPDDPTDLNRIRSDIPLMCELAQVAIEREFGIALV